MSIAPADNTLMDPPAVDWDPWSTENLLDPYPLQQAVRDAAPIVWLSRYGTYATGRHEESKTVMVDFTRFSCAAGTSMQDNRKPGKFPIPSRIKEVDPPAHTPIRAVANRVMSPIVIRTMKAFFADTAARYADHLVAKGSFEAVDELVEPYIIDAFPAAVGIRLRRKEALTIAEMRFNQSGPPNELYQRAMVRAEPYLAWYDEACQRHNVVPDSVADLLFQAEDAGDFAPGLASNIVRSFVGGGVDSTISAIGHTLHHLARNPEQFARVKADPRKITAAFDEGIRMDTPFQFTWRTTAPAGANLGAYSLAGDTKVTVFLAAANRDPRRWDNPDRYDVNRETAGNYLGFGLADHNCIGQNIARFEASAILAALVSRCKSIELAEEPTYRPVNQLRMLKTLRLKVVPE